MFTHLSNEPADYAWGAPGAISLLLGTAGACRVDGGAADRSVPQAELWLGAHRGAPAAVESEAAGRERLDAWIARDPETVLGRYAAGLREGDEPHLPFLLKVLAAGAPLSLQAHPTLERARAGYAAEDAAGIPVDAPTRNYRDRLHKPELLWAVSERVEAIAGFRDRDAVVACADAFEEALDAVTAHDGAGIDRRDAAALRAVLADLAAVDDASSRRAIVERVLAGGVVVDRAVRAISRVAELADSAPADDAEATVRGEPMGARASAVDALGADLDTVRRLASAFPGDPGILIALLLHRVSLERGSAIAVPAGVLHAYLSGTGIEIMAASDNVLRGGLTPKHVDVPELLATLDFDVSPPPLVEPGALAAGVEEFRSFAPDFRLLVVRPSLSPDASVGLDLDGPSVVLCLEGSARLDGASSTARIERGEALLATPEEGAIAVSGEALLVVGTSGVDPATPLPLD